MSGFRSSGIIISSKSTPVDPVNAGDMSVVARSGHIMAFDGTTESQIAYTTDMITFNMLSTIDSGETNIASTTTLTSTAFGKMHSISGVTSFTTVLPNAVGNISKIIGIRIDETATAMFTIACSGSQTIDASGYRMMWAGESVILKSNGSNWNKIAGKTIPMTCKLFKIADQAAVGFAGYTLFAADTVAQASNSACYSLGSSKLLAPRPGVYKLDGLLAFGWNGSTQFTQPSQYFYKNGASIFATANRNTDTYISYGQPHNAVVNLNTSDYIQFYGNQQTVGGIYSGGPTQSYVSFTEIPNW